MQLQSYLLRELFVGIVCVFFSNFAAAETGKHWKLSNPEARYGFEEYKAEVEGDSAFKVFIMSTDGAWSWRVRLTFEQAFNEALTSCRGLTSTAGCQLFAVGNTIVWDMKEVEKKRVIAEYKSTKLAVQIDTTAPLTPGAIKGFGVYLYDEEGTQFKVFVINERSGAWSYRRRTSYEEAVKEAMNGCDEYSRHFGDCRLFAVGNKIVWDMGDKERDAEIKAYRSR